MKRIFFLLVFTFFAASIFAQSADAILGKWMNSTGEAHIQIYKKDNKYYGKLAWIKNPNNAQGKPKTDINNPDSKLKSRSILGLEFLQGFIYDDSIWENGTIYDPKSGKTYSCKITMTGTNQLNVRGFLGISLIGRTDTWSRIN